MSSSSYSTMAVITVRKKVGTIVDIYGDIFQYSELKKRPRKLVASSGSMTEFTTSKGLYLDLISLS